MVAIRVLYCVLTYISAQNIVFADVGSSRSHPQKLDAAGKKPLSEHEKSGKVVELAASNYGWGLRRLNQETESGKTSNKIP